MVIAPWVSVPQPCPVKSSNRDSWTAEEREKAQNRVVATDLNHLQELASWSFDFYAFSSNQFFPFS